MKRPLEDAQAIVAKRQRTQEPKSLFTRLWDFYQGVYITPRDELFRLVEKGEKEDKKVLSCIKRLWEDEKTVVMKLAAHIAILHNNHAIFPVLMRHGAVLDARLFDDAIKHQCHPNIIHFFIEQSIKPDDSFLFYLLEKALKNNEVNTAQKVMEWLKDYFQQLQPNVRKLAEKSLARKRTRGLIDLPMDVSIDVDHVLAMVRLLIQDASIEVLNGFDDLNISEKYDAKRDMDNAIEDVRNILHKAIHSKNSTLLQFFLNFPNSKHSLEIIAPKNICENGVGVLSFAIQSGDPDIFLEVFNATVKAIHDEATRKGEHNVTEKIQEFTDQLLAYFMNNPNNGLILAELLKINHDAVTNHFVDYNSRDPLCYFYQTHTPIFSMQMRQQIKEQCDEILVRKDSAEQANARARDIRGLLH